MVVIDATLLMLLLHPGAGVPLDESGKPVERSQDRIAHLIASLERSRQRLVIPTPALSEVLVRVEPGAAQLIIEKISELSVFRIEPFDQRAAIEVAAMTRNSFDGGRKPARRPDESTWAKLKYDRQIVAIAVVVGARAIYSDDKGIRAVADRQRIPVVRLSELELPPESAQHSMDFEGSQPSA
ncbi:PIN domain-containing protein [Mesorhizobium kowhaii]|uniref:Uncharacterized protein n=1 Tax=Mesorhizobium kowhaii TaxID=1300272 RepID=A0A2W7C106_9HYPH|nr:PIN domain-containing protein [Mesorhizobium kowhaii]PZV35971.1 hypothetical protein B5V02_22310 [Mesorhizobium kowhaii]